MMQQPGQQPPMDPQQQHYQQQHQHWMWQQQQQQHQQQPPQQTWPQQQQYQQPPQQQQQPSQQYQQPPQQQQQHYQQQQQPTSADEVRTLWIGDLQYWMDESYITNCFSQSGELVSVKIIRNKQTMQSECYGFIEFSTHAGAERVLQTYNGTLMPNAEQNFRLNWASYGSGEKRADEGAEHTIFVGDLSPDVTDYALQEAFRAHYPSVKGAKVVMDKLTGRAKGYGFVRFSDESEQLRAMTEMNGVMCSGRAMRIGAAASKKTNASYQNSQGAQNDSDPTNTTIFVGNLDSNVTDEHLRQTFSQYGELVHVKIPVGKQCGFVQFTSRSSAEEALSAMNGAQLGGRNVRLSWGHNTSNRRPQAEQNQWNAAGYYGYPQGYDPYAFAAAAAAPQDPNMYYGGYPGYGGGYAVPQQGQQPAQHKQ
ncbi:hypothetical protein RND81_07G124100 [Saponaria officinalis]|uniref:RRM domain-containing protein n=1 Tax=Saponaria officinalis TaxID=3572 RepID=A0AAW1JMQ6_SAPOF